MHIEIIPRIYFFILFRKCNKTLNDWCHGKLSFVFSLPSMIKVSGKQNSLLPLGPVTKAGFHLNSRSMWSSFNRELLRLKWAGNTTRQLTPQKRAPGWWGTVWCPSTNSSLQISIFQIYQIFNISYFHQLTTASSCMEDRCPGCLGASTEICQPLDSETLPWLAIPAT